MILMESLAAFGMLTICVLLFFHQQTTLLTQIRHAQERTAAVRILYEEVKAQRDQTGYRSYEIYRNQPYVVSVGHKKFHQGEIVYASGKITITREK